MAQYKDYTILVADDEEILRESIVFDLTRKGFNVVSAANGRDAFELVKRQKIHLVISDIRMPEGDGVTLLEKIREYDPEIPVVILITGFAEVSEEECKKKGAKTVISKPFDRKLLLSFVLDSLGLPNPAAPAKAG